MLRSGHKLIGLGIGNVCERLRIAVCQRKPGALHLNHDAVAATEHVYRGARTASFIEVNVVTNPELKIISRFLSR